ncbi:hypothetical protein LSH36_1291g00052 [Paralvinella palmiformis]|uniref:Uncharacterized protein n=1 Tax=Paralvinella palmiformis TaxID=53620 RepID=A0AAD9MNP6_9ANNE|nr:hypothetical protein LSH36_1291g00052 [Paralvinella palmiformis]
MPISNNMTDMTTMAIRNCLCPVMSLVEIFSLLDEVSNIVGRDLRR